MASCRLSGTEASGLRDPLDISCTPLLVDVAAVQIADGFPLAEHGSRVTVIQLVLLGLPDKFARQVQEQLLHVVGLFGRRLQIQHALGLGEVFSPLPQNLPLFHQIYFVACRNQRFRSFVAAVCQKKKKEVGM